ncbi:MAG TPA: RdgB/HAM1 family non-canonical purine NTP pyrophosphatase [Alphaproteobacteria bacterium]|nr:non-canonical purine NTP pyrophosphatase, RdgB/HAM1 family [Rhodospirillaceae bacterium]HRJ13160.1 RdgB/HAM1 family non-canonical purine NTP pyrophosphatase [Alphaproteobacteria bacterium]
MRRFKEPELLVASHNKDKISEIQILLSPYVKKFITSHDQGLPEPNEDGKTFHENARIKALTAAAVTKLPALADDSGLCVEGLDGAPGIYSSRWAGSSKDFTAATQKIFRELGDNQNTRAEFVCVLALAWPDGDVVYAEGRSAGNLIFPGRGDYLFGYDPFFVPDGYNKTFAELGPEGKAAVSHRARAFDQLVKDYFA